LFDFDVRILRTGLHPDLTRFYYQESKAMKIQIPTLLIAEDDDNDFVFLERALESEKFEANIRRACDGAEAIDYLCGENQFADREAYPLPHLLVLDLKMPGRNGFEVLEWLRAHSEVETFPVVVFSSSEEPEDVQKAYELGASGYLVKPSSYLAYSELVRTLRGFLVNGSKREPSEIESRTNHRALNSRQVV
jgi:CheY-like chemotaxis protein